MTTYEVPLSQGKTAIVENSYWRDLLMSMGSWTALKNSNGNTWYARHTGPRDKTTGEQHPVTMHRVIMGVTDHPQIHVDHINGDGLDNRSVNLRIATTRQNTQNIGLRRSNTSGFIGVYWNKDRRRWMARLSADGQRMFLGYFNEPEEAARARDIAAVAHHGSFARLNFPMTA